MRQEQSLAYLAIGQTLGSEPGDPYSAPSPSGTFLEATQRAPAKLRVAFMRKPVNGEALDPVLVRAIERTARLLEELGHQVEEASPQYDAAALEYDRSGLEVAIRLRPPNDPPNAILPDRNGRALWCS